MSAPPDFAAHQSSLPSSLKLANVLGMTILDETTEQRSSFQVVEDEGLTRVLATKIADNYVAKLCELTAETIRVHTGQKQSEESIKNHLNERSQDGQTVWVCWDDVAMVLRTEPETHIITGEGGRPELHHVWHWKNLNTRN